MAAATVTQEQVDRVADATSGAYSHDRFEDWQAVVRMLLARGYSEKETAAILLSKWTRWAADEFQHLHHEGRSAVKDLEDFLDGMDDVAAQVAELVRETF